MRGQRHDPAALSPREKLGIHCTGGWVGPRQVWTGAENLAPTGIRSPDRPACSQSLYRLSYPAHSSVVYDGRISQTQGLVIEFKMPLWKGNCIQHKALLCIGRFRCVYFDLNSHSFRPYCLNSKTTLKQTQLPSSNILRFTFHCFVNVTLTLTYWLLFPFLSISKESFKNALSSNVFVQDINCTQNVPSFKINRLLHTRWITAFIWVITERVVVISYRPFGTVYRSHLQGSKRNVGKSF